VTATLTVTREGFGIELRRGTFDIFVDGRSVGTIEAHETTEAAIEPGGHTLQLRAGRYSSRSRRFEIADHQVLAFRCHGANLWPIYVASIVKPDLAISLKPE
jgi:hypothetical protein